jgi:peptide/nickel transport system permease protein
MRILRRRKDQVATVRGSETVDSHPQETDSGDDRRGGSWRFFMYVFRRNKLAVIGGLCLLFIVLMGLIGPLFTAYSPTKSDMKSASLPPSATHWMGTDAMGMDIFTRVIYAARIDLYIAAIAVVLAAVIGSVYGAISAFYGKVLDEVMMRLLDSFQAFPSILLGLAIAAALGPSLRNVIIVLVVVNVPMYARLVRSQILYLREAPFVDAARTVGNSNARIMFRHLLPNSLSPVYVQASLNVGWSVLMAASLSFLGLGVQAPQPEWGLMVSQGARQMVVGDWWSAFFPGLFILLFVLSSNLLGDGLQDVFDPRRR